MSLDVEPCLRNLKAINREITRIAGGTEFAIDLAAKVAPELTDLAHGSFGARQSVYGDPRTHHNEKGRKFKGRKYHGRSPGGKRKGDTALTLVRTGTVLGSLTFTSRGTSTVTAVLSTKYARYLIGKYGVLPNSKAAMPVAWQNAIKALFRREIDARIARFDA